MSTLGEYLRARREHVKPGDVGLPDNGRRRTPGLRREEVATLAGVSVDYLVRLEQGRDTNPSPEVLAALSNILLLDDHERDNLVRLAAVGHSRAMCPVSRPADDAVARTAVTLLDQLDPVPAFVLGPFDDVLAWNPPWGRLVESLGLLDAERPNLARHLFLHPGGRGAFQDWAMEADRIVGRLRRSSLRWSGDNRFERLLGDLIEAPAFAERWAAFAAGGQRRWPTTVVHPDAGSVRLDVEVLGLAEDDQHLVTWLPESETAAAALARAIVEPGAERDSEHPVRLRVIT